MKQNKRAYPQEHHIQPLDRDRRVLEYVTKIEMNNTPNTKGSVGSCLDQGITNFV